MTLARRLTQRAVGRWNHFFFGEVPALGPVAFRVFLGVWSLLYWVPRFDYAWELYCRPVLRHTSSRMAWLGIPPLWLVQVTFAVLFVCLLGFIFSSRPRYWHIALAVPLFMLTGLDTLMGRAYGSLATVQWLLLFLAPYDQLRDDQQAVRRVPASGVRLLQLQWAAMYLFTVPAKLQAGKGWLDGSTLWTYLHSEKHGVWLLSAWVDIPESATQVLSITTLLFESFIPIGIFFSGTRRFAMISCVLLHAGILIMLRVSLLFPLLMWGHLLLFIQEDEWNAILKRFRVELAATKPS